MQVATNFFSRWSQRKLSDEKASEHSPLVEQGMSSAGHSTDVEPHSDGCHSKPPEESTLAKSEGDHHSETHSVEEAQSIQEIEEVSVANLLTTGAESAVKKAALRKLFLSGEFSEVDALNDYDHDYKAVKTLSKEVAETLRGWVKEVIEEDEPDQEHLVQQQADIDDSVTNGSETDTESQQSTQQDVASFTVESDQESTSREIDG